MCKKLDGMRVGNVQGAGWDAWLGMCKKLDGMRVGNVQGAGWDGWLGMCKELDGMHGWECVRSWIGCVVGIM
jgi:hypothetical protein